MICYNVKNGLDFCGSNLTKRWAQRVVLINKKGVIDVARDGNIIAFQLGDGLTGEAFDYLKTSDSVMGNFETVNKFDYAQFRHNVQIPFASFMNNLLFVDLVRSEFFAALLDGSGRVWIFGYDYTLRVQDGLVSHTQVDVFIARSDESGLEDTPPLRYYSANPKDDFYNNFAGLPVPALGEFSDDFNDDFNT